MAIIVGDIHGNLEKAKAFLDYKSDDLHVALGDYLDSFIEPPKIQLKCLRMLMESNSVLLLGNHEVHYLKESPHQSPGYNREYARIFEDILEANIQRFRAAYDVDGWLLSHAGVNSGESQHDNTRRCKKAATFAKALQNEFENYLLNRFNTDDTFAKFSQNDFYSSLVNQVKNQYRHLSIFYNNYQENGGIFYDIEQIFAHNENNQPKVKRTFIALGTTNCTNSCWLYDTTASELVQLPLRPKIGRVICSSNVKVGARLTRCVFEANQVRAWQGAING